MSESYGTYKLPETYIIGRDGHLLPDLPSDVRDICGQMTDFYDRIGFHPPWIGYLAFDGDTLVGGGGFVVMAERVATRPAPGPASRCGGTIA